jgi:photosystem II stability/assembly factor-like uncharacterized protein
MILVTIILVGSVFAGITDAFGPAQTTPIIVESLKNVRDYAPATGPDGESYAVDGGRLFAGQPDRWQLVETPQGVIVSAVAVDRKKLDRVFIGAANEMAIYLSGDAGQSWMRIPLETKAVGGVTAIAVDGVHRLIYVGTDTDGLFRFRDVGVSLTATHHLLLDEPVLGVVADNSGMGIAFVRTEWNLYRAENMGLSWIAVEGLPSLATAVAIADGAPATVFVGTANSGLVKSTDGVGWQPANSGLDLVPGSQIHVDALAVDPIQPDVLYVSTSYLLESTVMHSSPVGVFMSTDGGESWSTLAENRQVAVVDLIPVSGQTGSVYALTRMSRTPLALGIAPVATEAVVAGESLAQPDSQSLAVSEPAGTDLGEIVAWVVAGLAGLALVFALVVDLRAQQRRRTMGTSTALAHRPIWKR